MYRMQIDRKDLKVHYREWKPIILSSQSIITDNIDLMPIVRLLSMIRHEIELMQ